MISAVSGTIIGRFKRKARPVSRTTQACENLARWVSTRGILVAAEGELASKMFYLLLEPQKDLFVPIAYC